MMAALKQVNIRTADAIRGVVARVQREREFLLSEVLQVRGLMPLIKQTQMDGGRQGRAQGSFQASFHAKPVSRRARDARRLRRAAGPVMVA
jgi:hypothetical protein